MAERGAGESAGYVASAFFAGQCLSVAFLRVSHLTAFTAGRILLLPMNKLLGENNAVYAYLIVAVAMEFVIIFARSLIGNGTAVALIGLFIGTQSCVVA